MFVTVVQVYCLFFTVGITKRGNFDYCQCGTTAGYSTAYMIAKKSFPGVGSGVRHLAEGAAVGWVVYMAAAEAGAHRDVSHRSYELDPRVRRANSILFWLFSGVDSKKLGLRHRVHHGVADGEHDTASLKNVGRFGKFLDGLVYDRSAPTETHELEAVRRYIDFGELNDDPALEERPNGSLLFRREPLDLLTSKGLLGPVLLMGMSAVIGKERGALRAAGAVGTMGAIAQVINTFGHNEEARGPDEAGVNLGGAVLAFVTAGGSRHGEHHRSPADYRIAGGPDPAARYIETLAAVGLARLPVTTAS